MKFCLRQPQPTRIDTGFHPYGRSVSYQHPARQPSRRLPPLSTTPPPPVPDNHIPVSDERSTTASQLSTRQLNNCSITEPHPSEGRKVRAKRKVVRRTGGAPPKYPAANFDEDTEALHQHRLNLYNSADVPVDYDFLEKSKERYPEWS